MDLFDWEDIERSFTTAIFARGRMYARGGKVLQAWIDEDADLLGIVKGSEPKPYEVVVRVTSTKRSTKLASECTCEYRVQCKHAAALALYALEHKIQVADAANVEEQKGSHSEFSLERIPDPPVEMPLPAEIRDWLNAVRGTTSNPHRTDPSVKHRLFYRIEKSEGSVGSLTLTVRAVNRTALKAGGFGTASDANLDTSKSSSRPKHWTEFDSRLVADLNSNARRSNYGKPSFCLDGRHGDRLLREILSSGRCEWGDGASVKLGDTRKGFFQWEECGDKGLLSPSIKVDGATDIGPASTPWYFDRKSGECGPIDCGISPELAAGLLRRGSLPIEHLKTICEEFERWGVPQEVSPSRRSRSSFVRLDQFRA